MSNIIKFATINPYSLQCLSDWNVAMSALESLRNTWKAADDALDNELSDVRSGERVMDDAEKLAEIERLLNEIDALEKKYKQDCRPYNEKKRVALKLISDQMYAAYMVAVSRVSIKATGSVTIHRGKKDVTYTCVHSFAKQTEIFLRTLGIEGGSELKVDALAEGIASMVGARAGKILDGEYIKGKSETTFKDMFLRAFIQFAFVNEKAFDVNENHTITLHDFSKDQK